MLRQLDIVLVVNMELPKLCSCWRIFLCAIFLMKYEMVEHNCDGCMFGVVDLLQKSWTIASSGQSLAKLQQYKVQVHQGTIMDSPGGRPSNVLSLTRMK